jgi:hypothetical protein
MNREELAMQLMEKLLWKRKGLCSPRNPKNLTALMKRDDKESQEIYKTADPENQSPSEVQGILKKSIEKPCRDRAYAEKNGIPVNCSFREKLDYIKEMVNSCTFMTPPIQVVGKEHPAKENLKKQEKKKEGKCQEQ